MASLREVRCRCGRRMLVQPEVRAVQCSICHTVTQLYSLVDVANSANRMIYGFQQLRRKQQRPQMMAQPLLSPYYEQQQPQMMMAQSLPSPRQYPKPQKMVQPPPQCQYPIQYQQMMAQPPRQYQQPQMMTQPPRPRQRKYYEQQPQQQMMIVRPPPPLQYHEEEEEEDDDEEEDEDEEEEEEDEEPQMTVTQPPLQYHYHEQHQQEPQMMIVRPPPKLQYPKQQQQQMMAKPSPPRLLKPLPSAFGKKRAVLCGVNYKGKSYSLKGCITDAKSMRSLLVQQMGFPIDSILMLTEDEDNPQRIPTKRNIRNAMRWLVEGNRARDSLVFHFSGHGSQQKDYDGDEIDGQDETLIPLDHETEGKIVDDEINRILVRPLVHGAKLHAIIDACNSGTVLDLPFICRMERNGCYEWEDHRSVRAYKGTDGGSAFCFSACDDHESSGYTPVLTGKNAGTMTYSFINAVKTAGPAPTYGHLLNLMCSAVREAKSRLTNDGNYTSSDATAEPLLTSSDEFNVYKKKFRL